MTLNYSSFFQPTLYFFFALKSMPASVVYERLRAMKRAHIKFMGFTLTQKEIKELMHINGRLNSSTISGYTALFMKDLAEMNLIDEDYRSFYTLDCTITFAMASQDLSREFKPGNLLRTCTYWSKYVSTYYP
jgi:hypothetical protein